MAHHVTSPMVRPELADGGRGHQPGETAGFSEFSWPEKWAFYRFYHGEFNKEKL